MITMGPGDRYRGPGGPNPAETRDEREQELMTMVQTEAGREIIYTLFQEDMSPLGSLLPSGPLFRERMIPAILAHEYPSKKT